MRSALALLFAADMLTKRLKLNIASWALRSIGGLLWLMVVAALVCKFYEKPLLGLESAKLDTLAAILSPIAALLLALSGKLKPKVTDPNLAPIMSETREQRLRREWLKRVKATWGASAFGEEELSSTWQGGHGGSDVADEVEYPRNMALMARNRAKTPLPPGTKVIEVFDKVGSQLLILGGAGAGKTTALLELTHSALARAEQDPLYPIPFVFNLSSWSKKWDSFEDWLIAELTAQPYSVPEKYARSLIEGEHLLLLLDGLDEVAESQREECIRAINRFHQVHEMTHMTVCCRIEHYMRLRARIQASKMVLLPLTKQQIQDYLERAGADLAGLLGAVRRDEDLVELARSPLMLNLLVCTYRGMPADMILGKLRGRAHAQELFSAYIERMLELKRSGEHYTKRQIKHWLAWLAGSMERESLPIFLVEWMQPSLLRGDTVRYFRAVAVVTSLIAYWNLLKNVPLFARTFGYAHQTWWMLAGAGAFSFIFGQLSALISIRNGIRPAEKLNWSWESSRRRVIRGFIVVFALTILLWLAMEFDWLNFRIMAKWLILGLGGLWGGTWLAGHLQKKMIARGKVNGRALFATVYLGPVGLILGWFLFIALELLGSSHPDILPNMGRAAKNGLIWAGVLLPINLLLGGMSFRMSLAKLRPNQGIYQSINNAGLVYIFAFVLILVIFFGIEWVTGHLPPIASGSIFTNNFLQLLAVASALATLAALTFGGLPVIDHFALRFCLYKQGVIPWRYVKFLDYAADRALLKKVGGGYIFVHSLLQEHFASLEPEPDMKVDDSGKAEGA